MQPNPTIAAAERLRRVMEGESLYVVYGKERCDAGGYEVDCRLVAYAYLASLRGDDGELLTEEWLRSVGFEAVDRGYHLVIQRSEWAWTILECTCPYGLAEARWGIIQGIVTGDGIDSAANRTGGVGLSILPKTRGQLRQLCNCLGIDIKENSDG